MSGAISIEQSSFQEKVLKAKEPVLVDFWAPWCGPCRAVAPIVDELAKEYEGKVTFAKVNVDENPFLASSYGVMSIPTLIVFNGGKPAEQVIGLRSKSDLKKIIDSVLGRKA